MNHRTLARVLASQPGALAALQNPDGSINNANLAAALARLAELESAADSAMHVPMPGKSRHNGWRPMKSGTAGRHAGHRGDVADKARRKK
jgi:hypothetical protein